ncbi:protein NRT1/ PTR FAMILY 8.1 isoform X1 [Selaginella moellendorffii]|uniref:protein NRT1/ PTR FAMILY 8.1 isoform X1 n=1 Tax=Selaginella moellendorffii TaxID=88036 RepID=UPI000D1CBAB1|nr:protein NRT1/ PTR FAMILY 8.1 isoform X1 [Selaginella moellendorffii]|eukprot:XP_024522240.1 protein NRT1/ PTR FAMILY 8.1 isoform X1 [Selaginella moellendorffii]
MELESKAQAYLYAQNGTLDFKGRPALKKKTGRWPGAIPMLGEGALSRFLPVLKAFPSCAAVIQVSATIIFFGIVSNLVTYLTTVMHQGVARSARDLTNWQGTLFVSSVLGAFLSDTYWGRYKTLLYSFLLYCVGLSCLTISASVTSLRPPSCPARNYTCRPASTAQNALFFFSLYAIAFAGGSSTASFMSFGADQFDESDDVERPQKYSFFNFLLCAVHVGGLISVTVLVYIEDNVGFSWGFGILVIVLSIAMAVFLIQTPRYRYRRPDGSPLTKIAQVLVSAFRKRRNRVGALELYEEKSIAKGKRHIPHTDEFLFLDKAALKLDGDMDMEVESTTKTSPWKLSTVTRVEEVKLVIRMLPVWFATLWFTTAPTQSATFFLRQGMAMDNRLGSTSFKIPPASMLLFSNITVVLFLPFYDRILVPAMRKISKNERGITLLQRTGLGIFVTVIALVTAALVEIKRKDENSSSRKLGIFWLLPQYALLGMAEGLANTSMLEFFHEQSPDTFHSLGISLGLANLGVGSFMSSVLITCVGRAAPSWLQNDVNAGHLDRYYWLMAGLSVANLAIYVPLARWYSYKSPDPYAETTQEP